MTVVPLNISMRTLACSISFGNTAIVPLLWMVKRAVVETIVSGKPNYLLRFSGSKQ